MMWCMDDVLCICTFRCIGGCGWMCTRRKNRIEQEEVHGESLGVSCSNVQYALPIAAPYSGPVISDSRQGLQFVNPIQPLQR